MLDLIIDIDREILLFCNGFVTRLWSFDEIFMLFERNRFLKGAIVTSVFWYLWFSNKEVSCSTECRKKIIASIIGAMAGVLITIVLTNVLPFRTRPLYDPNLRIILPSNMVSHLGGWTSFPSDTATLYGGLATGIYLVSKRVGLAAITYILIYVLMPRVFLGFHYPTDILAGILIGSGSVLLANAGRIKERYAGRIVGWSETYPNIFYALFFAFSFELSSIFLDLRDIGRTGAMILKAFASRFG